MVSAPYGHLFDIFFITQGHPTTIFGKYPVREDDLRSRIFGTFVVKFLACLPLPGLSNF